MDLSWELEQLGRAAAPDVLLEGRRLLHRVSDLLQHDDGPVDALVRGEVPQVVTLPGRYSMEDPSCSCGRAGPFAPCAHTVAVRLRELQLFHGLDDARTARWERRVESLRALSAAWEGLASVWLESIAHDDDGSAMAGFRDAGSLEGGLQVARALDGRASSEQLSTFLLQLAAMRGIDGTTPLGPSSVIDAFELACQFGNPAVLDEPGACTGLLLAVAGSSRRTATVPAADWRVESAFTFACGALGQLVATGHADAAVVADALLQAELAAPAPRYPLSAITFESLGAAAQQVAREMSMLFNRRVDCPAMANPEEHRLRLCAEIGFASEGVTGLLTVLEEWDGAPYGEFLCRLPRSWMPMPRVQLLESARRHGRVRWAPGWPQHVSHSASLRLIRHMHDVMPEHPMWGDVAIGDLVLAVAQLGRTGEARALLRDHALQHPAPSRRHEFERIWAAAKLGDGAAECAAEIFGPATDDLGELLAAISRIPEPYFASRLSDIQQGIGAVLLTAVLLEDIPPEGHARNLDAPVWATSFLSSFPAALDDLDAFATLPADEVARDLEGAVLHHDLALRAWRIAGQLVEVGCPVQCRADVRDRGGRELIDALEQVPDAGPVTAALVCLLLGNRRTVRLDAILRRFVHQAVGEADGEAPELLEKAYSMEPRGENVTAYLLALVAVELDGRAERLRRR